MPPPERFGQTQADGALWCTAADLAKLGRFVLTDGASAPGVLRPETGRLMKQAQGTVGTRAGLAYGAGLGLHHRIVRGTLWQGHSGGVLGGTASMHFHPEQAWACRGRRRHCVPSPAPSTAGTASSTHPSRWRASPPSC